LDYFDIAQEILALYLQQQPDSISAVNLQACIEFKLSRAKNAEKWTTQMLERRSCAWTDFGRDLFQHNLVVFRNGEGALQTWYFTNNQTGQTTGRHNWTFCRKRALI
jgi:intraflagellar transport protein 56